VTGKWYVMGMRADSIMGNETATYPTSYVNNLALSRPPNSHRTVYRPLPPPARSKRGRGSARTGRTTQYSYYMGFMHKVRVLIVSTSSSYLQVYYSLRERRRSEHQYK
jgi:hypothetical protein